MFEYYIKKNDEIEISKLFKYFIDYIYYTYTLYIIQYI